jgi:hypothetical protein
MRFYLSISPATKQGMLFSKCQIYNLNLYNILFYDLNIYIVENYFQPIDFKHLADQHTT